MFKNSFNFFLIIATTILAVGITFMGRVDAQEKAEKDVSGMFLELGGFGSFPVTDNINTGGGGQFTLGYDQGSFALGLKIKETIFSSNDSFYLTSFLLNTKIFPFRMAHVDTGPFRIYGLLDGGIGVNLDSGPDSSIDGDIALDLNAGGGIQWVFFQHGYLAFETYYHGYFADGDINAIETALNLGFIF